MKTLVLSTLVLASMTTLALSQESRIGATPGLLAAGEVLRDPDAGAAASDPFSNPFSYSPEALLPAEGDPSFSIGPVVGYLHAPGADRGTWFGGAQARLHFARILAVEASISFHENRYEGGDVSVTQYPVQLTAFLYPFPDGPFRPYLLGGVGWYYTRIDYTDSFSSLSDKTEHIFGEHLGLGVELMLGTRTSLDLDVRYVFLNPTNDQVIHREFNYWQITLGLNFFL